MKKNLIKHSALTVLSIMLYLRCADLAFSTRGYFAVGGEVFALLLPVFYYLSEDMLLTSRKERGWYADKKSIQHQIEPLSFGGYLDEAETHVRLSTQVNTVAEFEYLKEFARNADLDFQIARDQLRALWTVYCLHAGYDADTAPYDYHLRELWEVIPSGSDLHDFDTFYNFMCTDMV